MTKNHSRRIVLILTLGVFAILNTEMGIVGVLPHIVKRYHISLATAGMLVSGFALLVAFSGPTMPLFFSKLNRKLVMLLATGCFLLSTIVSMFASSFWLLLIVRIIPALLHPVYVAMAMTTASQAVPAKDAQKAVAKVFMGVSAGSLLGVPVSNYLANHFGLAVAFGFFSLINLFAFLATLCFMPNLSNAEEVLSYGRQLIILKRKSLWASVGSVLLLNGAIFGFNAYLADYLIRVTSISINGVSMLLLIIGLSNLVGNILAGILLSKYPQKVLFSLPIALVVILFLLFILSYKFIFLFLLLVIFGILSGIAGNTNQYMLFSVGQDAPDFANGLFLAAANLGVTIGTAFCGQFIYLGGSQYTLLGSILMLVLGWIMITVRARLI